MVWIAGSNCWRGRKREEISRAQENPSSGVWMAPRHSSVFTPSACRRWRVWPAVSPTFRRGEYRCSDVVTGELKSVNGGCRYNTGRQRHPLQTRLGCWTVSLCLVPSKSCFLFGRDAGFSHVRRASEPSPATWRSWSVQSSTARTAAATHGESAQSLEWRGRAPHWSMQ